MAQQILNARIKHKRDSDDNFKANNPMLLNGEIIIVDDDTSGVKIKIGDGFSLYSQLPFFGAIYSEKPEYSYTEIVGLNDVLLDLNNRINLIPVIPSGVIMIWSGNATEIPDGWVLCNGENGAPDLTDKFVLGAGNNYSVGLTGGEAETILTVDQIPSHTHGYKRHAFGSNDSDQTSNEKVYGVNNKTIDAYIGVTDSTGGDQSHNNMPPYYALCYIMKV